MIKRYIEYINETGMRDLSKITKNHKECEIFFHIDLDGVTSALAMKEFLKNYYQITTINCHKIQYGNMEFAIESGKPDTLKVLVDFAHGKPMFQIQSDHHQNQVGAEYTQSTYFKPSRSNVEIISGEISYSDVFTPQDVEMIQTIDSANFLKYDIKPEDVENAIFKYNKDLSSQRNRFMMGFVVNRLLLAYKNKNLTVKSLDGKRNHVNRNILECLVLDSNASLYSIFNNLKNYIKNAKTDDKAGVLATPEEITKNLSDYIERMKNYKFIENPQNSEVSEYDPHNWRHQQLTTSGSKIGKGIHFDEKYKIISQYGGGALFKPGSYDRYVPFKNYPDAEFICIIWPMGLIQASCNPFKEKKIKDINLGEIAKEVLAKHEQMFRKYYISLESIKKEFETSQEWNKMQKSGGEDYEGIGFKFTDLKSFYNDCVFKKEDSKIINVDISTTSEIQKLMDSPYYILTQEQKAILGSFKIPIWELIVRNSGGHPSITNLTGFNFMKYNKNALKIAYGTENYTEVLKIIGRDLINTLKEKIDIVDKGEEIEYDTKGIELKGMETNE